MLDTTMTRRGLISAATLGAGAAALAPALAGAAEASAVEELTPTQTIAADAVVIGSGTSGLIAATRAAELGKSVVSWARRCV